MIHQNENESVTDVFDALTADDGYCLVCPQGHGSMPPRVVCPVCGQQELTRQRLSRTGTIETHTTITVAPNQFGGAVPYGVALADFGPIDLMGHVRNSDLEQMETGATVVVTVDTVRTNNDPTIIFEPVTERGI